MFLRLATPAVFAFQFLGIWIPSVWEDEVATIGGSNRTLDGLWQLVNQVDLVHGSYYLLVHFWGQFFGFSALAIRSLSALAVTVAFAFVYLTASRLGSTNFARNSSMIFALLPAVTWSATEARSYSLTVMFAAILTYLFVRSWAGGGWLGYFAVATLAVYVFMYLILVVLAHLLVLLVLRRPRDQVIRFVAGFVALGALSLPLILGAMGQSHQVSWIQMPVPWLVPTDVLVMPYFLYTLWPPLAALVVLLAARALASKTARQSATLRDALIWAMLLVPALSLLLVSLVTQPVYVPRYVSFGAIAMAMLLAAAIDQMPKRWMQIAGVLVIVASAIPSYLDYRAPDGKLTDWSQAAQIVADSAGPEDAILFSDDQARATISRSVFAYPELFEKVTDVTLVRASQKPRLLPRHSLQPSMISKLGSFQHVWLLNDTSVPAQQQTVKRLGEILKAQGFRLVEVHNLRYSSVLLFGK